MCLCLFVPCNKICVQLGSRHVSLSVTASAAHLSVGHLGSPLTQTFRSATLQPRC